MIALDTNILVRYFVQDDLRQFARAQALIEEELTPERPGFVTIVVIVELSWVLQRGYGATPSEVASVVGQLLRTAQLAIEEPAVVEAALAAPHGELADALIHEIGRARDCEKTVTFDHKFARLDGVELLG